MSIQGVVEAYSAGVAAAQTARQLYNYVKAPSRNVTKAAQMSGTVFGPRKSKANRRTAGLAGLEFKYRDHMSPTFELANAGGWQYLDKSPENCLFTVPQGSGPQERVGRKQFIHSIHLRYEAYRSQGNTIARTATSLPGDLHIRLVMFIDTQTNKAQATISDPYEALDSLSVGVTTPLQFRDLQYTKRFKIIFDKKITMTAAELEWNGVVGEYMTTTKQVGVFTYNKTFKKPLLITYDATGYAVGDLSQNSLHMMVCHDFIPGDNKKLHIRFNSRVRYTD